MPSDVQVCAVQLPGRENRLSEPPSQSTTELVPLLVEGLRPFLDRPYAFFGHSMGALLAFEATRTLRSHGMRLPGYLFLSSHRAPHLAQRAKQIHRLQGAEFIDALRNLRGTPEEVLNHEELMQIAEPILRADFGLCERYVYTPGEPLNMPMSVFGGLEDMDVLEEDLSAWAPYTTAAMRLRMFAGHHLYLREGRDALLAAIRSDLAAGLFRG